MSHKKKTLEFDVEILKVKLEQVEKRLDWMEKAMSLMERTHKAEMMVIARQEKDTDTDTSSGDDSESDTTSSDSNHGKKPGCDQKTVSDGRHGRAINMLRSIG